MDGAPRPVTRPRGMALFVILGIVTVTTIGVFALNWFLKTRIHHEEQTILHDIGRNLAESVVAYVDALIQYEVNEREGSDFGEKFRALVGDAARAGAAEIDLTPLLVGSPTFDPSALKAVIGETENPIRDGEPFFFDPSLIKITLSELKPLTGDLGVEDGDRVGILVIRGAVGCGGRTIAHTMKLRVKVVDVRLPVLSKFTLAVFDLPPGKDGDCYNRVLVDRKGDLAAGSPCRPLVLDNAAKPGDLNAGGWVFLGASDKREILLNKAGGYEGLGEMFHFYDRDGGCPEPAMVAARSAPGPDPDLHGLFPSGEECLAIVDNYWGFHDGMNVHDVFSRLFAAGEPLLLSCSSFFRLYGVKAAPSPTRVIGNVLQRTPYYAVLATLDPSTGLGEYPAAMLKSVEEDEFADALIDCFTSTDGAGVAAGGAAPLGWPPADFRADRLFCGKYAVYQYFMSDVWLYPYNYNYEFLGAAKTGFDPNKVLTPDTFLDKRYLVPSDDFRLVDGAGKRYFSGSLMDFSAAGRGLARQVVERKAVARYDSGEEFFKNCLVGDRALRIPGVVIVKKGPLRFDRRYEFRQAGVVALADGDIEITAGISTPRGSPLTLVALGGNVQIATAEPVDACLVALKRSAAAGTGGFVRASGPIRVKGGLVADHLDPEDLAGGGTVAYDPRLDPFAGPDVRVYLEDRDLRFETGATP